MAAVDAVPYTIKVADSPAVPTSDDWVLAPHLIVETLTRGLAPTMSQATLVWRFGQMRRAAGAGESAVVDDAMEYREPLDLRGKYVLIEVSSMDVEWIGYVVTENTLRWDQEAVGAEQRVSGGNQGFTAFGLEWFLSRAYVCGTSSNEADKNGRAVGYNMGTGDARELDAGTGANRAELDNEAAMPTLGELEYSFEDDALPWNAGQAAIHLLYEHGPRNDADALSPVGFQLRADAYQFLASYKPIVPIEGRTVLEILDSLISRRRGLVWWITHEVAGDSLYAEIHVSSIFTDDLELPNPDQLDPTPKIPAALEQTTVVTTDYDTLRPPVIVRDGTRYFDRIRVRGARRTSTLTTITSTITENVGLPVACNCAHNPIWSAEDEVDYLEGVSGIDADYGTYTEDQKGIRNDLYRKTPKFERVFRHFVVSLVSESGTELQPIVVQSTGSIVGSYATEPRAVRIGRLTMLKAGYDYEDATSPTKNGDTLGRDEYQPAMAFANVQIGFNGGAGTINTLEAGESPDAGWRRAESMADHEENADFGEGEYGAKLRANYSVTPLAADGGFAINVHGNGGMPHSLSLIGDGGWDGAEPSRYEPVIPWDSLAVTMTIEWDCYCEAVWPTAVPTASPVQELLINIGDRARFDWLVKGTIYDLGSAGEVKQVQTEGALRDDRSLCETIARIAHGWYSSERAMASLDFRTTLQPFGVGALVTEIGTGAAAETVNAICSQITHSLESGGTSIQLGFAEVDFSTLA